MTRNLFGWSLPPGVTDRMIDEAAGALEDDFSDIEEQPEDEDDGEPRCTNPGGHNLNAPAPPTAATMRAITAKGAATAFGAARMVTHDDRQ